MVCWGSMNGLGRTVAAREQPCSDTAWARTDSPRGAETGSRAGAGCGESQGQ